MERSVDGDVPLAGRTGRSNTIRSQESAKFKIAICGAGIAGLVLAAFISRSDDIVIDIYESQDEVRTAGAGIALWKRYWNTLVRELDFDRACVELKATATGGWDGAQSAQIRRSDNPEGLEGGLFKVFDHAFKSYARQGVLAALLSKLNADTCKVHTQHRLVHYTVTPADGIKLYFGYTKLATCDILIGADGIHSRVRSMMYESIQEYAKPTFSGQYAYRTMFSAEKLKNRNGNNPALIDFNMWCGKGRHIVSNAIGPKIYVTAYENVSPNEPIERTKDWVKPASAKKVLSLAEGWEPDLITLLKEPPIPDNDGHQATRWAVHTVSHIPSFVSGPVAIIGDAAHAMLPHQGLGACQGIEDAYVLSQLLHHPLTTKATLAKALQAFDTVRRPLAQEVAKGSELSGKMFDFEYEPHSGKFLEEIGRELASVGEFLREDGECKESADAAVKEFESLCGTCPYGAFSRVTRLNFSKGNGIEDVTTVSLRDIEGP
ncbi:MAG: hypothetical protein Q9217_004558 [Psora testacea]